MSSMDSTAITFLTTTTLQVIDLLPTEAVMVVSPSFTAVTFPFSTVAIEASDVVHVTVLSMASSGLTVAVKVSDSPSTSSRLVLFNSTDVTAIMPLLTVTEQVADFPPAVAVMVVFPSATAVTRPLLETVATDCFDEPHMTVLSVAFEGDIDTCSWVFSPIIISAVDRFSEMEDTGTSVSLVFLSQAHSAIIANNTVRIFFM